MGTTQKNTDDLQAKGIAMFYAIMLEFICSFTGKIQF